MPGFVAVVTKFLAQLDDHLVQRARCPVIIVAPDFAQQLVPRQHLARVGVKDLQQFQLLGGKFSHRFAALDLERLGINGR